MLLAFIILYLIATLAIGLYCSRFIKNSKDFALAGRNMSTFITGSALFATWFGSETVMGASSEFLEHGVQGIIEDPFGAALCLALIGVFFARPLYKMNLLTMCDFFRERYGKEVELVSAIMMMVSYFSWTAAQYIAFAIILQTVTGLSLNWGVLIAALIVAIYTNAGGLYAISYTDFIQTIIIILGLGFLLVSLFIQIPEPQILITSHEKGFFNFFPEANPNSILHYLAAWMIIGLGSIPQQDVFQRVMSAKSEETAVRASYLSAFMYLTVAFIPIGIVLCAKVLYPELIEHKSENLITDLVLQHSSIWVQILFFGALLSAILSTASGSIIAPATILAENIIKPRVKNIDDKTLLKLIRISVLIISVIAIALAKQKASIFDLVAQASMLSLVSLFIPLCAGLWWKKANSLGMLLSMFLGIMVWAMFEIFHPVFSDLIIPSSIAGLLASALGIIIGIVIPEKANNKAT